MSSRVLSGRANQTVRNLDVPWRFCPPTTYDPDTNPDGLISFAYAENKLVEHDLEAFAQRVRIPGHALNTYGYSAGGGAELPSAIAAHLNEHFNPYTPLSGTDVRVTASATALHEMLGWAVGDPGDCVLLSKPVYGRLEVDFGNKVELQVVYAETASRPESCFEEGVVRDFEAALADAARNGIRIRALMIVNPHNPLGRCYTRPALVALMRFCQRHRLHLISDEVYGCSVHTPHHPTLLPFTSALSVDPTDIIDPELLHVTYGLSKDFGAAGLRLGALITRSRALQDAVQCVTRFHSPSGPSVALGAAMLRDRAWCNGFLETSRARIAAAYKHATEGLAAMGIKYLEANAGFFVYIDLSPYIDHQPRRGSGQSYDADYALTQKFVDQGVFLQPGEEHGLPGWFRFVFTQDPRTVTEGLRRMKKVLDVVA
ncbi:1-aminocyclopropane-1-carboxylate synthase [Xylariaceae sp. FL0016]|nr:1-aminocyclopropane-1-carboxylate synthase [Xylariaceae sp. FL0016]